MQIKILHRILYGDFWFLHRIHWHVTEKNTEAERDVPVQEDSARGTDGGGFCTTTGAASAESHAPRAAQRPLQVSLGSRDANTESESICARSCAVSPSDSRLLVRTNTRSSSSFCGGADERASCDGMHDCRFLWSRLCRERKKGRLARMP